MNNSGYFANLLKSVSKEGLSLNDLSSGEDIKPLDALLGRKPMDYEIMREAERAKEEEYYKRINALTADTKKAITFGDPRYIEGIDPELFYFLKGDYNGPRYENIPNGYSAPYNYLDNTGGRELVEKELADELLKGVSAYNPGYKGFGDLAGSWYTKKGHADTADKARIVAEKAIRNGLDPYMALALGAQEGGWMHQQSKEAPYNYFGWGETDSGSLEKGATSLEEWLDKYLPSIAGQYGKRTKLTDWGGSDTGYSANSPFEARYNYNDSWTEAIASLIRDLDQFRRTEYPQLAAPMIDYSIR